MTELVSRLSAALADRYQIERSLGEGGMATVYLAQDLKHGRQVALKVLKPELAAVLGAERFVQEIKTTASLQHPHILPLFDSGTAGTRDGGAAFLYYVMPYVEGETLRDKLDRETQLSVDEAVRITIELADALDYAHRHDVIHRDIKPENILLHDGRPMLADFGIALAVSAAAGGRMTETGLSLGTPHYMSPEQATAERELTHRSDIYSLGCVLYEMLTGDPPHVGSSAQQIIMKIVTEDAAPVTQVRKAVPPHVAAATGKALEKLAADRFGSAREFADVLEGRAAIDVPAPATAAAPAVADTANWRTRLRDPFVLIPLVLLVLVAVASWMFRAAPPMPTPVRVELDPPTGTDYWEQKFAALSPDGRRFAFVALGPDGGSQLWIRDLADGSVDSLAGTRGATAPFWSPDGGSIGYVNRGALWRQDIDSRAGRELCTDVDPGGSWSRENVILFTSHGLPMTVDADGGSCDPVPGEWSETGRTFWVPVWLPDGRRFVVESPDPETFDGYAWSLFLGSLDGGPPSELLDIAKDPSFVEPDLLLFHRTGQGGSDIAAQRIDLERGRPSGPVVTLASDVRTAFQRASYAVGGSSLIYLPATRVDQGPLVVDARGAILDSVDLQGAWTWRVSTSGRAVALGGAGLWVYDLVRRTPLGVKPSGFYSFPIWSPGDSMLAATDIANVACGVLSSSGSTGSGPVVVTRVGGGGSGTEMNLFDRVGCAVTSDWTADGRMLVLTAPGDDQRRWSVWTYTLETEELEQVVAVDGTASGAVVSPDMQWLAYVSNETGNLEVYVRQFREEGAAVRVSINGGASPRWLADSRGIVYVSADGSLWRATVRAGRTIDVGIPERLFHIPRWSSRLYADQRGGTFTASIFDVSPDGRRFYVRQPNHDSDAAKFVLNWQSVLDAAGDGN